MCPTRRQKEADARGTGPIPEKDPAIEQEFTRPVGDPTYTSSDLDKIVIHDDDIACRRMDVNDFYPVGTGPDARRMEREAKAVCRTCPQMDNCLSMALARGEQHGIWGGATEAERRRMNAQMAGWAA